MSDRVRRATYTVREVGKLLGIGRNQAYEACRRGEIPIIRLGGRILVPRAALERLLGEDSGVGRATESECWSDQERDD